MDIKEPKYPRTPGWEFRLTEFLQNSEVEGFACDWDNWNCAKWASRAVEQQNNRRVYALFDGVEDGPSAYMALKRKGFKDFEEAIRAHFPEKPRSFANRGDLVFVQPDGVEFDGLGMSYALGIAEPPFFYALGRTCVGRGLMSDVVAVFDIEEEPA